VKAKGAKPARVYPAESDPRQAKVVIRTPWLDVRGMVPGKSRVVAVGRVGANGIRWDFGGNADQAEALAREFGPWVRGADGRWQRDRRFR